MWIVIRWTVYVLCIGVAVVIGIWTSNVVYELLDFQVTIYSAILQWQQALWSVVDTTWEYLAQAKSVLWWWWNSVPINEGNDMIYSQKLSQFIKKLSLISGSIWFIVWLLIYYILTSVIFGLRSHIQNIKQFIR